MTIDMENVAPDSPALFRTIRQVVLNQRCYAPAVELALCMSRPLYEQLRQAWPTDAPAGKYLFGLPVYVFDTLPSERLYLVPEYVAQAWAKAEPGWIASLGGGRLNANAAD